MAKATYKRPTLYGNLRRILINQCDIPMSVYVETGLEATLGMFASIVSPDPKEVYHALRGRSVVCELKGLLNQMESIPPEDKSYATRFLFRNLEQYDLLTWYLFLADVAHDGLVNWTSQAIRVSGCGDKQNPKSGPGTFFFGAIPDDGSFQTIEFGFPDFSNFAPVSVAKVAVYPGDNFIVSGHCEFTDFNGIPVPSAARIRCVETGMILDHNSVDPTVGNHESRTKVWYRGGNASTEVQHYVLEWAYTGGIPLPLHEAFPNHDATVYLYGNL